MHIRLAAAFVLTSILSTIAIVLNVHAARTAASLARLSRLPPAMGVGACCTDDGKYCFNIPAAKCGEQAGTFLGANTHCTSHSRQCTYVTTGCCFTDAGLCLDGFVSPEHCETLGADWSYCGLGNRCRQQNATMATHKEDEDKGGACCIAASHQCFLSKNAAACAKQHGVYCGTSSTCSATRCRPDRLCA